MSQIPPRNCSEEKVLIKMGIGPNYRIYFCIDFFFVVPSHGFYTFDENLLPTSFDFTKKHNVGKTLVSRLNWKTYGSVLPPFDKGLDQIRWSNSYTHFLSINATEVSLRNQCAADKFLEFNQLFWADFFVFLELMSGYGDIVVDIDVQPCFHIWS